MWAAFAVARRLCSSSGRSGIIIGLRDYSTCPLWHGSAECDSLGKLSCQMGIFAGFSSKIATYLPLFVRFYIACTIDNSNAHLCNPRCYRLGWNCLHQNLDRKPSNRSLLEDICSLKEEASGASSSPERGYESRHRRRRFVRSRSIGNMYQRCRCNILMYRKQME